MQDKTAIVIRVDRGLWTEFRKRALDEKTTTVDLVEKAIRVYLSLSEKEVESRLRK